MPALKLAQSSSSIPSTTLDCNKTPPIEAQPDLAPLTRINAVSLFARTTTAGQFHEEAAGEGDSLQRMRSNNIHPALYLQLRAKVPAPPQPTGVEGCVDLEKVNERLMEFVRRARAEKERLEARERIERKAEMKRAMGGEKVLEDVVKAVNHAPRGEESEPGRRWENSVRRQARSNSDLYAQGYLPQVLQLRSSQSMNVLMRSLSPLPAASPSPWTILGTAHTRISFPPLSRSLSPTSPQQESNPEHRQRGSYDRPDWSESDENGNGSAGGGAGLRVGSGLRLLVKKSESVFRKGGGGRSKEAVTVGVGVLQRIPERSMVMRMQNDSVVSREVGTQGGGWRCGCWMK